MARSATLAGLSTRWRWFARPPLEGRWSCFNQRSSRTSSPSTRHSSHGAPSLGTVWHSPLYRVSRDRYLPIRVRVSVRSTEPYCHVLCHSMVVLLCACPVMCLSCYVPVLLCACPV